GWPQAQIGWADIIALAERPEGWASCPTARVEWGRKPLVGFTDPTISSTARSTLQLLNVVGAGKPAEQFTPDDVNDPRVRDLARQPVRSARSDLGLDGAEASSRGRRRISLERRGPARVHAMGVPPGNQHPPG